MIVLVLLLLYSSWVSPTPTKPPTVSPTGSGGVYSCTGSVQSFVVPSQSKTMTVVAYGAGGFTNVCSQTCVDGAGAKVTATFSVTAGTIYYVYVGCQGSVGVGGFNGGGGGGHCSTGGSGATDVRTIQGTDTTSLNSRIVVAGGGGGCYGGDLPSINGGAGGSSGGKGGDNPNYGNIGGTGGTQTGGGVGCSTGTLGVGGIGGCANGYGAGGGGGYYGGGGGQASGGGGGSSYPTTASIVDGYWTGHGQCVITFTSYPSSQPSSQPSEQPSGQPSRQPSSQPTRQPSAQPTFQPTSRPSQPSSQPTGSPSMQPLGVPSGQPTIRPLSSPSRHPTSQPSRQPTAQPSRLPSSHPSSQPSRQPSLQPVCKPSSRPTTQPSRRPSRQPSVQPSTQPSSVPSGQPSAHPTHQPTTRPSVQPSSAPSRRPSGQPSTQPSSKPSSQPNNNPTRQPTSQPTHQPTSQPSSRPSSQPSSFPTAQPSSQPTHQPSRQPSIQPSAYPTNQPTCAPTVQPSSSPTARPSEQPSAIPTHQPSTQPSKQPSARPSHQPSSGPTGQPSVKPSRQPTATPSEQPTGQPTHQPSAQPSNQPSRQPSGQPSEQPSCQPSGRPSFQPTAKPSLQPTVQPSEQPSQQPTIEPTCQPSSQPSKAPSSQPSNQPTHNPSSQPTVQPVVHPSSQPSSQPTQQPSSQPSVQPSCQPSREPTSQPSDMPSAWPTDQPTGQPLSEPSSAPSLQPTVMPSVQPSVRPSGQPSTVPSAQPSESPTSEPSTQPSVQPTIEPSMQPSSMPTLQPTDAPSSQPSRCPSSEPSRQPSVQPTCRPTTQPTLQPSRVPSCQPAASPSVIPSEQPSSVPTKQPLAVPSVQPSEQPSSLPTSQPSIAPTSCPTVQPTNQPSQKPTCQPTDSPSTGPSAQPSGRPSNQPFSEPTVQPSVEPTGIPSVQPSAGPTTQPTGIPSFSPTTVHFRLFHPQGTLPPNASMTVQGGTEDFKIVLPYGLVYYRQFSFADIELSGGSAGTVYVLPADTIVGGYLELSTSVQQARSLGVDSSGRSASRLKDINGDGIDDLIVGDPHASRCYVFYGNENGLKKMITGFTIYGETDSDLTCWSVSGAGDVNNDTYHDIIIGAPNARGVGAAYVIYGYKIGWNVFLSNFTSDMGFSVYGILPGDLLGVSVSDAGDFNNDGCDDVIVGGLSSASLYSGLVGIVYGRAESPSGLNMTELIEWNGGLLVTDASFSHFGYSVSGAGDINNDGFDDVLVGSYSHRSTLSAKTYVIFGRNSTAMSVDLSKAVVGVTSIVGAGSVVSGMNGENNERCCIMVVSLSVVEDGLVLFIPSGNVVLHLSVPSQTPTNGVPGASSNSTHEVHQSDDSILYSSNPSHMPSGFVQPPLISSREPTLSPSEEPTFPVVTSFPSIVSTTKPTAIKHSSPSATPSLHSLYTEVSLTNGPQDFMDIHANRSADNMHYSINATVNVFIGGQGGCDILSIAPNRNTLLTVSHFNLSCDAIDLRLFWPKLEDLKDLIIISGEGIEISLLDDQIVHLLNVESRYLLHENNFLFGSDNTTFSNEMSKGVDYVVIGIAGAFGVLLFLGCLNVLWYIRLDWMERYEADRIVNDILKRRSRAVRSRRAVKELLLEYSEKNEKKPSTRWNEVEDDNNGTVSSISYDPMYEMREDEDGWSGASPLSVGVSSGSFSNWVGDSDETEDLLDEIMCKIVLNTTANEDSDSESLRLLLEFGSDMENESDSITRIVQLMVPSESDASSASWG